MKSLRYLLLGSNKLTGNLPCLPNAILDVKIWYNKLNGSLPIFPNTLKTLDIAGNAFTGTINLTKPETVLIASNYIVSIIIQDKSVLNSCDISNNPLLGYAGLVNLPTCTKTGLYTSTMAHNTTSPICDVISFSSTLTTQSSTQSSIQTSQFKFFGQNLTFSETYTPISTGLLTTFSENHTPISVLLSTTTETHTPISVTTTITPLVLPYVIKLFNIIKIIVDLIIIYKVIRKTPKHKKPKKSKESNSFA